MPRGRERRKKRFTGGGRKRIPGIGRTGTRRIKEHGVFKERQEFSVYK